MSTSAQILWLGLAVSVVLPALVALVTKQVASSGVKAITLLVLAAITGFSTSWLEALNAGATFDLSAAAVNAIVSFIVAVAVHLGFLKPISVTGSQGVIQTKVPGGLGQGVGRHELKS